MDFKQIAALFILLAVANCAGNDVNQPLFSREHTGVLYNPPNIYENKPKVVQDYAPSINAVAAHFRKLTVSTVKASIYRDIPVILTAVASYNRDNLKANDLPLELSILYVNTDVDNVTASLSKLNIIMKAAENANKIFHGTVKRIVFEHRTLMELTEDMEVKKFEQYLANTIFPYNSEIEMGALFQMDECESDSLPQILKHIHHIDFYWSPTLKELLVRHPTHVDPREGAQNLTWMFSKCHQIMKENSKNNISVGLYTGWFSLEETVGLEHTQDLILYWGLMNEFAIKFNLNVVLTPGFDAPHGEIDNKCEHCGWWKIMKDNSGGEYLFEEKINVSTKVGSISSVTWAYIGISILIFIATGSIFIVLYVRKHYSNTLYIMYARYFSNFNWFHF